MPSERCPGSGERMDLREVLASIWTEHYLADHEPDQGPLCTCGEPLPLTQRHEALIGPHLIDAFLARLSQPDVLDEFERRLAIWLSIREETMARATRALTVLSDMLGGGS